MIYSKLAMRNLRRNSKDYGVYALTVVLSVALFYAFNAISRQDTFLTLIGTTKVISTVTQMLSLILTAILAALIIYANRFLVKRRQRELGVYVSLGMEQSKISGMFCLESLSVGVGAMVGGIGLGVVLSQVFAMIICKMFGVDITALRFTFSGGAVLFTILVFALTFVLVALFNFLTISRLTLLELLCGGRKNEKSLLRSRRSSLAALACSIALIVVGYVLIITQGMGGASSWQFKAGIGVTALGTVLFYISVPALVTGFLAKRKAFYYQGIHMFSLRQLGSRLSINSILLGCLALAITISIGGFSFGMAMRQNMIDGVDLQTPFDINMSLMSQKAGPLQKEYDSLLNQKGYQYKRKVSVKRYQLNEGERRMRFSDLLTQPGRELLRSQSKSVWDVVERDLNGEGEDGYTMLTVISLGDLNRYLAARGEKPLALGAGEYAYCGTHLPGKVQKEITSTLEPVSIGGREYHSAAAVDFSKTAKVVNAIGYYLFVLPDEAAAKLPARNTMVFGDLNRALAVEDARELEKLQNRKENEDTAGETDSGWRMHFMVETRAQSIAFAQENGAMVTFIGLYVGTVFMIIVAAVLALQQLVSAAEQRQQYGILEKVGARESWLRRTVLCQIAAYFATPMFLGFLNGGLVTWLWNDWMFTMNGGSQSTRTLYEIVALGVLAFLAVYALYFMLTYAIYKRTVLKDSR